MIFENENLDHMTSFRPRSLDFFLDIINIKETEEKNFNYLIKLMKQLPASIRKFHGYYKGGLFDHTLLVSNICFVNFNKNDQKLISTYNGEHKKVKINDLIRTALFHDLGKVDLYTEIKKMRFEFYSLEKDRMMARYYTHKDYKVIGKDDHIERCICVIKNAELNTNPNIQRGIIFHHGGWSGYKPQRGDPIAAIVHAADMIASQFYHI